MKFEPSWSQERCFLLDNYGILPKIGRHKFLTLIDVLVIRLARTGRRNQATYRVVVAEKSAPVKGRHTDVVGFYNPGETKKLEFDKARIEDWISKGAKPSDTVAALLKNAGMPNMEQYMSARNLKRAKKNPSEEELAAAEAAANPAPAVEEAPAEEAEAPAEEAAAEEKPEDKPAEEAAPAEEAEAAAEEEAAE